MITPNRVVVQEDGLAASPKFALEQYGVRPEIVFVRVDGWVLGAPRRFEHVAFALWENDWVQYQRIEDKFPGSINYYRKDPKNEEHRRGGLAGGRG